MPDVVPGAICDSSDTCVGLCRVKESGEGLQASESMNGDQNKSEFGQLNPTLSLPSDPSAEGSFTTGS